MAPSIRFISRVPGLKLKLVLAPRRVMVRSLKVNSLRDCVPVLTGVPWRIRSLSATGRGAAFSSTTLTSFTTWVTRAACNCTPCAEVAMAIVQIKADAAAMNFVCGVPANSFVILPGILVHKERHRCRLIYGVWIARIKVRETGGRYLLVALGMAHWQG